MPLVLPLGPWPSGNVVVWGTAGTGVVQVSNLDGATRVIRLDVVNLVASAAGQAFAANGPSGPEYTFSTRFRFHDTPPAAFGHGASMCGWWAVGSGGALAVTDKTIVMAPDPNCETPIGNERPIVAFDSGSTKWRVVRWIPQLPITAISADGRWLGVGLGESDAVGPTAIELIDLRTGRLARTIPVSPAVAGWTTFAVDPNGDLFIDSPSAPPTSDTDTSTLTLYARTAGGRKLATTAISAFQASRPFAVSGGVVAFESPQTDGSITLETLTVSGGTTHRIIGLRDVASVGLNGRLLAWIVPRQGGQLIWSPTATDPCAHTVSPLTPASMAVLNIDSVRAFIPPPAPASPPQPVPKGCPVPAAAS